MVIGNENYEWEHLEKVSANTLHSQLVVQLAALDTARSLCWKCSSLAMRITSRSVLAGC